MASDSELWAQQLSQFDSHVSFVIHDGNVIKSCIASCITSSTLSIWWLYSDIEANDYLKTILLAHLDFDHQVMLADIEIDSTKTNSDLLYRIIPSQQTDVWQVCQYTLAFFSQK